MIPFKFFSGKIYTDEYTVEPPFGISRRHWNMLPRDLRNESRRFIEVYIEGWEAVRNNTTNPYVNINDPEVINWSHLWNRGYMISFNRRIYDSNR